MHAPKPVHSEANKVPCPSLTNHFHSTNKCTEFPRMLDLKRLLRRKTRSSSESTTNATPAPASTAIIQAPPPDDTQQRDPPPYYASSSGQSQNGVAQPDLLDPTLNFTAAQMEQQWLMKDKIFARAIVQF